MKPIILLMQLLFVLMQYVSAQTSLLPVKQNYKWGFIDTTGKVVIAPVYDNAGDFKSGMAVVQLNNKSGVIDSTGKLIIPFQYDDIRILNENFFSPSRRLYGMIDRSNTVIIPFEYTRVEFLNDYSTAVITGSRWGLYHNNLKTVIAPQYDSLVNADFKTILCYLNGKVGLIDSNHREVIPAVCQDIKLPSAKGIMVKKDYLWGIVDMQGNVISDYKWSNWKKGFRDIIVVEGAQKHFGAFSLTQKKLLGTPSYDGFFEFDEKLFGMSLSKKYGLMDYKGKIISLPEYDFINKASDHLIRVGKNNLVGLINYEGDKLLEVEYIDISDFQNHLATCKKPSGKGIVNDKGKLVVPCEFTRVDVVEVIAKCYRPGHMSMYEFDNKGNLIDKTVFNNVQSIDINERQEIDTTRVSSRNNFVGFLNNTSSVNYVSGTYSNIYVKSKPFKYPAGLRARTPLPNMLEKISYLYYLYDVLNRRKITQPIFWDVRLKDLNQYNVCVAVMEGGQYCILTPKGKTITMFPILVKGRPENNLITYIDHYSEGTCRINIGGKMVQNPEVTYWGLLNDLFPYSNYGYSVVGGKWSFIDGNGNLIFPAEYDWVSSFHKGLAIVSKNKKFGVVNKENQFAVELKYDDIQYLPGSNEESFLVTINELRNGFIDSLGRVIMDIDGATINNYNKGNIKFSRDGKVGYTDQKGNTIIEPKYLKGTEFSEGVAGVVEKKLWGFIDVNGNYVIEPKFGAAREFSEGLAAVRLKGDFGFIDHSGNLVIQNKFSNVSSFHDGVASVAVSKKYGIIDKTGKWIVKPHYRSISDFKNGYARIKQNKGVGIISNSGKVIIPATYDKVGDFNEGVAWVMKDGLFGIIDSTGKIIVKPMYDRISNCSEGMIKVELHRKIGYINKTGTMIVEPAFAGGGDFHEGKAWFVDRKKKGFINQQGKIIIPAEYDNASDFSNGLATVKRVNGKRSEIVFIDSSGVNPFRYDFEDAQIFVGNLAVVKRDGKWGVINRQGIFVVEPRFSNVYSFKNGVAKFEIKSQSGVINSNGTILLKAEFEKIQFYKGTKLFRVERGDEVGYLKPDGTWMWPLQK